MSLADSLGAIESDYHRIGERQAAKVGLRALLERERTILFMRYFADMSQIRIAERVGVPPVHVSRLLTRSCALVRDHALDAAAA